MVTGLRRGELCALRWRDLDLDRGTLTLARSIGQRGGSGGRRTPSPTSSDASRSTTRPSLSCAPTARGARTGARRRASLPDDAFVFSQRPDGSTHLLPDSVSQRYARARRTSRHQDDDPQAAALLGDRADLRRRRRADCGRPARARRRRHDDPPGLHGVGVGVRPARTSTLFSRMPSLPAPTSRARPALEAVHPYEVVAHALVEEIKAGAWPVGELLPSLSRFAEKRSVSVSTVQRAMKLLDSWAYVQVVTGRGARVLP